MSYKVTSLSNKVWNIQRGKVTSIKDLVAVLLNNRGIKNENEFLSSSIRSSMPDPFVFVDMEKAVNCIVKAIKNKQKVAILGDYDVDGIASTAIFINFLNYIGAEHAYAIPSRLEEGYGLSKKNIDNYKDCLIIAVDCGSGSIEELDYAKNNGVNIVVIDHHSMSCIPEAIAIVNPHRPDEKDDYKYLCATGLVFLCVVGVNRLLRESGFYCQKKEPNLMDYLDLVALATVCDVVSLIGLNRAFVSQGLKAIKQRKNLGIDALVSLYRNYEISSEAISFFFGPRLNAPGRLASAEISLKLLITQNPIEARKLAQQLEDLNKERQLIEREITEKAMSSVDESLNFICLYEPNWHIGVVGIVAGRLKEKYNKPTIIISRDENGRGKASCRSIDGVDISAVINKAIECGIINSGGGHCLAAGFSIDINKIAELVEFLKKEIKYEPIPQELYADCLLDLKDLSIDFIKSVAVLEPFGMGNRHPKFVISNLKISSTRIVGERHISSVLKDDSGNTIRAISFKAVGTPIGEILLNSKDCIDVLGSLTIASWKEEKYISLQLEDASAAINH